MRHIISDISLILYLVYETMIRTHKDKLKTLKKALSRNICVLFGE